jgi:hypothetical protein
MDRPRQAGRQAGGHHVPQLRFIASVRQSGACEGVRCCHPTACLNEVAASVAFSLMLSTPAPALCSMCAVAWCAERRGRRFIDLQDRLRG